MVTSTRKRTKIAKGTQDIVSALYFARSHDFSKVKPGDMFSINFVLDDELFTSEILFEGRDTVEVEAGKIACLRFKPKVLIGTVFDEEYPMTLWVSDDANKLPVLAESEVIVGSVRMELISYDDIAHPMISMLSRN